MKWLFACVVVTGCAQAAPPNAIIGGLIDGGRDNGGSFDPDASVIDAPPDVVTLSQTSSNMVVANNSVGCVSGDISQNNSYYRVFTPSDTGVTGALHLTQIDFGVEFASTTGGAGQTGTLRIGTYVGDRIDSATVTLTGTTVNLSSTPVEIKDTDAPTAMSVPVSVDIPANTTFIVELNVPGTGSRFFIGSNTGTETKPAFTSAQSCSLSKPTSFASIASDNDLGTITMVMSATGTTSSSR